MDAYTGVTIDHIDRNILNNQRSNLRFSNMAMNHMNSVHIKSSTGYKGVSWIKRDLVYYACIAFAKREIGLLRSQVVEDCAYAYNYAAITLAKEFAYLNPMDNIDKVVSIERRKEIQDKVDEQLKRYADKQ